MNDEQLVKLAYDYATFNDYVEGIDAIDGQTYDLINQAMRLESTIYTDGDCIAIVKKIIQNYHQWHKIDAGEEVAV